MIPTKIRDRAAGWKDTAKAVVVSPRMIAETIHDLHNENRELRAQLASMKRTLVEADGRTVRVGETHFNIPGDIPVDEFLWVDSDLRNCRLVTATGFLGVDCNVVGCVIRGPGAVNGFNVGVTYDADNDDGRRLLDVLFGENT